MSISVVENYVEVLADDVTPSPEVAYRGKTGEKYELCTVCGVKYPRSEMVKFRGSWYSYEFGCSGDIQGIIDRENENRERSRNKREYPRGGY